MIIYTGRLLPKPRWPERFRLKEGAALSLSIVAILLLATLIETRLWGLPNRGASRLFQIPNTPTPPAPPTHPFEILVDTTQHTADSAALGLSTICETIAKVSGSKPAVLTGGSTNDKDQPEWYRWARLDCKQSIISVPQVASTLATSSKDTPPIEVYAAGSDTGGAICMVNRTSVKYPYVLKVRLPHGVFCIERLSFYPTSAAVSDGVRPAKIVSVSDQDPDPDSLSMLPNLRRLEGADNASVTVVNKPGELAPHEVTIVRFTDVARVARVSYLEVCDRLHEMAFTTPAPARRLRRILDAGSEYLGGINGGGTQNRLRRIGCVHRLLLLTAQAESLHRNFQSRQTVNAEPGARTMDALERMGDALAETSAALTGLVPQIELSAFKPISSAGALPMEEATATVSVSNTGQHTVDAVKLGLDGSSFPTGVICAPDDPAFFGAVHPSQTVRAIFTIRAPVGSAFVRSSCAGDVSYITAGAPAHLRARPW